VVEMIRPSVLDDVSALRDRMREIAKEEDKLVCECCGTRFSVTRDHRGTAYAYDGDVDDADNPNMATLCQACWVVEREYWAEMWREYYGGRL
jgi:hypothetical protein